MTVKISHSQNQNEPTIKELCKLIKSSMKNNKTIKNFKKYLNICFIENCALNQSFNFLTFKFLRNYDWVLLPFKEIFGKKEFPQLSKF